jgi:hypothetical protein
MIKMLKRIVKFYNKDRGSLFNRLFSRLYGIAFQNILLRKVKGVFKKPIVPEHWIIILSNYNSGSTLLRNILSSTNETAHLPDESVLYTKQLKRPDEEFGWQRNWVFCGDSLKIDENDNVRFNKYLKDISSVWILKKASKYFLEKSISNITRIGWYEKQCKSVKFIAIVRNPLASCEGMSRKSMPVGNARTQYGKDKYDMKDLALQYKVANEEIIKMQSKVNHLEFIKYEDLCKDPTGTLNNIFDYLQLDKNQFVIKNNVLDINGFKYKIQNYNDKSLQNLSSQDIKVITKINKSLITKFGYDEIK